MTVRPSDSSTLWPTLAALMVLMALMALMAEAAVCTDRDGIIVSWNPAAEQQFGWSSAEALGRSIELIVPADRLAGRTGRTRKTRPSPESARRPPPAARAASRCGRRWRWRTRGSTPVNQQR